MLQIISPPHLDADPVPCHRLVIEGTGKLPAELDILHHDGFRILPTTTPDTTSRGPLGVAVVIVVVVVVPVVVVVLVVVVVFVVVAG